MSINVTVKGNPISIKRGKMVTAECYQSQQDFDKRRLMRLEQVRQQSKDIAENIRNKVRKEKEKQLQEIEKEGKKKIKNWQNRKLVELQTQYKEALEEIGLGHKEAKLIAEDEEAELLRQTEFNEEKAKERTLVAAKKLQHDKEEKLNKDTKVINQKKFAREVENARSALISNLNKQSKECPNKSRRKKRKTAADINISIPQSGTETGNENEDPDLDDESTGTSLSDIIEGDEESSCSCTDSDILPREPLKLHDSQKRPRPPCDKHKSPELLKIPSKDRSTQVTNRSVENQNAEKLNNKSDDVSPRGIHLDNFKDTRISDRIRRRQVMANQPDYCDIVADINPNPLIPSITDIRDKISSRNKNNVCCCDNIAPHCKCGKSKVHDNCCCIQYHKTCPNQKSPSFFEMHRNGCCCQNKMNTDLPPYINVDSQNRKRSDSPELLDYAPLPVQTKKNQKETCVQPINISLDSQSKTSQTEYTKSKSSMTDKSCLDIPEKPKMKLKDVQKPKKPSQTGAEVTKKPSQASSKRQTSDKLKDTQTRVSTQTSKIGQDNKGTSQLIGKRLPAEVSSDILKKFNSYHRPSQMGSSLVGNYDHSNRLSSEQLIKTNTYAEKISNDDIELISNTSDEMNVAAKMRQRDREAHIRGKQALEKGRIEREYKEMMKKLPVLQKQERIADIHSDKQKYHMSDERRKELEARRQNALENAYRKKLPQLEPKVITIPSRNEGDASNMATRDECSSNSNNIPSWSSEVTPKLFTADEVQCIIKAFTQQNPQDRKAKLKELLISLKVQKMQLINEIKSLPKDNSISQLLKELNEYDDDSDAKSSKSKLKEQKKRSSEHKEGKKHSAEYRDRKISESTIDATKRNISEVSSGESTTECQIVDKKCKPERVKRKKQKVVELQNTSTQTTPRVTKQQQTDVPESKLSNDKIDSSTDICKPCDKPCKVVCKTCDCDKKKSKDQLEIVIKIDEGSKSDKVSEEKDTLKKGTKPKVTTDHRPTKLPINDDKSKSWKEHLSKISSSASTSYQSPPDFSKTPQGFSSMSSSNQKSGQGNISSCIEINTQSMINDDPSFDPRLTNYINKLLSMSRSRVDELPVSTSSISTPSQSIVETDTNNPLSNVHNMIKLINMPDIEKNLSVSPGKCSPCPNLSISHEDVQIPERITVEESRKKEKGPSKFRNCVQQYSHITDVCSKRIADLSAKIQQLREEKKQIIDISTSTSSTSTEGKEGKDQSTAYLDLKDLSKDSRKTSRKEKDSNPNSSGGSRESPCPSLDEEVLNKQLLEIDMNLANKLRKFQSGKSSPESEAPDEISEDLMERLQNLIKQNQPETKTKNNEPEEFVPFLTDIPKLPVFEDITDSGKNKNPSSNHRRPPVSKGIMVAKINNENISTVPHELSTIAEAESQILTKHNLSDSSSEGGDSDSTHTGLPDIVSEVAVPQKTALEKPLEKPKSRIIIQDIVTIKPKLPENREAAKKVVISQEKSSRSISSFSSSSSDESIEAMLKSIGMEWAIATVQKTKEALALSASSSSIERKFDSSSSSKGISDSDVSLKAHLKRRLIEKISSSTLIASSPNSLSLEFSDMSAIHSNNSSAAKNKSRTKSNLSPDGRPEELGLQRASTPVRSENVKDSIANVFTGETELSSVAYNSDNSNKSAENTKEKSAEFKSPVVDNKPQEAAYQSLLTPISDKSNSRLET